MTTPIFEEKRILASVEVVLGANVLNVSWKDVVIKDGDVVAETTHRKAYESTDRAIFMQEVPEIGDKLDFLQHWTFVEGGDLQGGVDGAAMSLE